MDGAIADYKAIMKKEVKALAGKDIPCNLKIDE
jgi:hypothetical protein